MEAAVRGSAGVGRRKAVPRAGGAQHMFVGLT